MDQIAAAGEKLCADATHVIVHDAARPAVPYSDIDALMEAAEKHDAVALAAPLPTTLVEVDEGGNPRRRPPAEPVHAPADAAGVHAASSSWRWRRRRRSFTRRR